MKKNLRSILADEGLIKKQAVKGYNAPPGITWDVSIRGTSALRGASTSKMMDWSSQIASDVLEIQAILRTGLRFKDRGHLARTTQKVEALLDRLEGQTGLKFPRLEFNRQGFGRGAFKSGFFTFPPNFSRELGKVVGNSVKAVGSDGSVAFMNYLDEPWTMDLGPGGDKLYFQGETWLQE